ncbi:MAG: DUF6551 family protein [Micropruina sp.]
MNYAFVWCDFEDGLPRLGVVSRKGLCFDPRLEREGGIDPSRVQQIADNFDPYLLGAITLNERWDGSLVVLDGRYRLAAAAQAGFEGEGKFRFPAVIHEGLTFLEEMEIFLGLNDHEAASDLTRFRLRVAAMDPVAVAITDILKAHGWKVGSGNEPGDFSAVATAEMLYRNADEVGPGFVLNDTMALITDAWGHDPEAAHEILVGAIGVLVGLHEFDDPAYGDHMCPEIVQGWMRSVGPAGLMRHARDIPAGDVDRAVAALVSHLPHLYHVYMRGHYANLRDKLKSPRDPLDE